MASSLQTTGTKTLCPHSGEVQATLPNSLVKVRGQPALTQLTPYAVSGCPNPVPSGGPCVTANWLTGSTGVKIMGQPWLGQSSPGISLPTGPYLATILVQELVSCTV